MVREDHDKRTGPGAPPPPPPSKAPFWIFMLVLTAALAALLVAQPEWLFPRPTPEPPELKEASLRVRMFTEIDRIEQFRNREGRMPVSLQEAAGDTTGVHYTPGEGGYSLTGTNGTLSLTYASSQSPREFLGNAYDLIRRRSQP